VRRTSLSHELLLRPCTALLLQATKAITAAAIPPDNSSVSPIAYVRHLVGSTSPNDIHLLLCLLETAEPRLWAGTDPQIPAVLDAFEVELIMQQLDSSDSLIRTKVRGHSSSGIQVPLTQLSQTLRVLHKVEPEIVVTYFSRMLESVSSAVAMDLKAEYALRVLQVAEVLSGEDSESYAQYLMRVLKTIEGEDTDGKVIRDVVDYALTYIRAGAFPGLIECTRSPATFSFFLACRRCRCAIDNFDRGKRSYGPHFPPDYCRIGVRV